MGENQCKPNEVLTSSDITDIQQTFISALPIS
jgi:hypothetical protein